MSGLSRAGARRYWWIWAAVIPILTWTAIRLFGLEGGYPLVAMMAFTPYVAVAALLVAGVALALRNWAAATLADRRLGIADYGVDDLPGSDHRAIHATIVLP